MKTSKQTFFFLIVIVATPSVTHPFFPLSTPFPSPTTEESSERTISSLFAFGVLAYLGCGMCLHWCCSNPGENALARRRQLQRPLLESREEV